MAEKWLITGGTGQVGLALRRSPPPGVEIYAPGRSELDLADMPDLVPLLEGVTAIVNCGAYTAVDKAENEPDLAHAINAVAPGKLAQAAAAAGIPIIHVSTDYVFAADGIGPWSEDAPLKPASVYGRTKADGETAVRASGARHAIIRTAWVISADGSNFVKTMLRLGQVNAEMRVVCDQQGTPTHAGDLAGALAQVTQAFSADPARPSGTWHCANGCETSWFQLAELIFRNAAKHDIKVPEKVWPITTREYPTLARRPVDSRLNCSAIARDFGIVLRDWDLAVEEIVGQLAIQEANA